MSTQTKTPIPTGLYIPSQVSLNNKEYFLSEADLSNLGTDNVLAFSYYKGMSAYCAQENTTYRWKEVEVGDIKLLVTDFIYPNGWEAEGIDYSNKIYNFAKIVLPSVDQNNYVRQIRINRSDLPPVYTKSDIMTYIENLPIGQKTIEETTSKVNVIIYQIIT